MFRCLPTSVSTSISIYSGTPLFQTSEMLTSHFNGHFAPVWITIPLTAIHYNSWNADTMLLRKVDGFFGPFNTWTVQNSLDNLDVHLPPMQGCLPPLIASTTEHYNSTGTHSTNLWSAFLTSIQQGRALDCTCSTAWVQIATPTKKLYRKPPKYGHLYNPDTQWWSHGVHNRGVPL